MYIFHDNTLLRWLPDGWEVVPIMGLCDERGGNNAVRTRLGISYEEAWGLWATYQNRPDGFFVSGVGKYVRESEGGWCMSDEGMPYLKKAVLEPN